MLLLCCHPIRGPPVSLSASHAAAEGALAHRAVNTEQAVGRGQLMNDAINHIAIRRPVLYFKTPGVNLNESAIIHTSVPCSKSVVVVKQLRRHKTRRATEVTRNFPFNHCVLFITMLLVNSETKYRHRQ